MEQLRRQGHASVGLLVASVALAVVIVYMTVASLHGPHGLVRSIQIEGLEAEAIEELALLRERRNKLENDTRRLGASSIDLDLLDERARSVLGIARTDEVLVR